MEEFLGILFCGGKGARLGEISKYISKSLLPVYDRPVFKFGLEHLTNSSLITDIILLTNEMNDEILSREGYKTIVQDDKEVHDMFSGWEYIKRKTGTNANAVLVPSDNICDSDIDSMIKVFENKKCDFLFSLYRVESKQKLSEMGSFDPVRKIFKYKDKNPETEFGVIAPYIIRNNFQFDPGKNIFETENAEIMIHAGIWSDIGDIDSLLDACIARKKNKKQ
ncbi:MAG: NTP transferase domain-containing protein [Ignavibacteria bacterium]|nr:NTP transferase domain-containing protein [Ignavibacteria bacterium]